MISRLVLTDFGKFKNVSFELAPVTVVYGQNESGKTTFFDAIFQALCDPSETKKSGKMLKARYGTRRSVSAEFGEDGGKPIWEPILDDEFLQLFAIRAGDLNLELSPGSDWMERLKARLFHGGLDPKVLVAEFERLCSDKRNFVHNKKWDELKAAQLKVKQDLDQRKQTRHSLLSREKSLEKLEASLVETRRHLKDAKDKVVVMDHDLAFEDRIASRQKINGQLQILEDWEHFQKSLQDLARFQHVKREDLDKFYEAHKQASSLLQTEKGKLEVHAGLINNAKAEIRALQQASLAAGLRSQKANQLAESARNLLQEKPGFGTQHGFSVVGAGLLLLAGGLSAFFLHNVLGYGSFAAALALATVGLILGARAQTKLRLLAREKILSKWKAEWTLATSVLLAVTDLTGFLQAMENQAREQGDFLRQEQEALRRLHILEEAQEKIAQSESVLRKEVEVAIQKGKDWLREVGLESGEELLRNLSRLADLKSQEQKRRAQMESLFEKGRSESDAEAKAESVSRELLRKLKGFDEEGIPEKGRDEASVVRLGRDRQEILTRIELLNSRERNILSEREGLAGEIRGALGNLAEEIVRGEATLFKMSQEIQSLELDKRAAAMALEIFRGIGDGSDHMLSALASEMDLMLEIILSDDRNISLSSLEKASFQVHDAGGQARSLENLSTGTRDAVVLSARLALALKSRNGAGILVLDEPFLAMDETRESSALELLRVFQSQHGWQILFLTKGQRLCQKIKALFEGALIVNLNTVNITL